MQYAFLQNTVFIEHANFVSNTKLFCHLPTTKLTIRIDVMIMLQYKISGKQEYIPRNWLMRQCQTHVCRKESDQ